MAFKQPKVPEYRGTEKMEAYIHKLTLFLRNFCQEAWRESRLAGKALEKVRGDLSGIACQVSSVNGKTGDVVLGAGDVGALSSNPQEENGEPQMGNPLPVNADQLGGADAAEYAKKTDIADSATKEYVNTTIIKRTYNSGRITQKPINMGFSIPEGYEVLTVTGVRSNGYTIPAYALYADGWIQIWWLADVDLSAMEITFDVDVLFIRK